MHFIEDIYNAIIEMHLLKRREQDHSTLTPLRVVTRQGFKSALQSHFSHVAQYSFSDMENVEQAGPKIVLSYTSRYGISNASDRNKPCQNPCLRMTGAVVA